MMPSRRVAAMILSAAVVTGATAGVGAATADVDLPRVLAFGGPPAPAPEPPVPQAVRKPVATPSVTPSATPIPTARMHPTIRKTEARETAPPVATKPPEPPRPKAPTAFVEVEYGHQPDGDKLVHLVQVEVPKTWRAVDKGPMWRDFHDPTDSLTLRIHGGDYFGGETPESIAEAQLAIRSKLPGFEQLLLTWGTVDNGGDQVLYYELRYLWKENGTTRYGVEWYPDPQQVLYVLIGGFASHHDELDLIAPAMEKALATYNENPMVTER